MEYFRGIKSYFYFFNRFYNGINNMRWGFKDVGLYIVDEVSEGVFIVKIWYF